MSSDELSRCVAAAAADIAEFVDRHRDRLHSPAELAMRQYGAAGLVRCVSLLRAAESCRSVGHGDAVGVLTRALFESWVSTCYVLFGGVEALAKLEMEQQRNEANLVGSSGTDLKAFLDQRRDEMTTAAAGVGVDVDSFPKHTVYRMADELGPLIEAETGKPANVILLYNLVYRSYSTFDVHGLAAIERQIEFGDYVHLALKPAPTFWNDPVVSVAVASWLVAELGTWVFNRFDLPSNEFERAIAALEPALGAALASSVASAPQDVLAAIPVDLLQPLTDATKAERPAAG